MFAAFFLFLFYFAAIPSGWGSTEAGFCIDRGAILSAVSPTQK
jgi:hypothetical protein